MKEHIANILTHGVSNYVQHLLVPGLRIRTHLFRSGSSILGWIRYWWPKTEKNLQLHFFSSKTPIYLSIGLHKERPSYRRSLQNAKESIQHVRTWNFLIFFYFCGSFLSSWIRIRFRIRNPDYFTPLCADTPSPSRGREGRWKYLNK